jgi:alpha-L-rhamnosidase
VILVCNYLVNPLSVHDANPRLSWQLSPVEYHRGLARLAYQIKVSSQPVGPTDLWDSGRIAITFTTQISYTGKALPSRTRA